MHKPHHQVDMISSKAATIDDVSAATQGAMCGRCEEDSTTTPTPTQPLPQDMGR